MKEKMVPFFVKTTANDFFFKYRGVSTSLIKGGMGWGSGVGWGEAGSSLNLSHTSSMASIVSLVTMGTNAFVFRVSQ